MKQLDSFSLLRIASFSSYYNLLSFFRIFTQFKKGTRSRQRVLHVILLNYWQKTKWILLTLNKFPLAGIFHFKSHIFCKNRKPAWSFAELIHNVWKVQSLLLQHDTFARVTIRVIENQVINMGSDLKKMVFSPKLVSPHLLLKSCNSQHAYVKVRGTRKRSPIHQSRYSQLGQTKHV